MWPFKKIVPPLPCSHKYKDFPWYLKAVWDETTRNFNLVIKEPYVCVHCKDRKDVILYETSRHISTLKEANDITESFLEEYKDKLKPLPVINDMIADMQLVDREYLDTLESILHPKDPFEKT